jgi:protein-tyrosine phosphatase
MTKILMVCLGNICRSPLAEGILRKKAEGLNIEVDSAGTAAYHVDESPDPRSIQIGRKHGVSISSLKGRQFSVEDYDNFDVIYVMDQSNYDNVLKLSRDPNDAAKVLLILNELEADSNAEVPDPYYGGEMGFENVYQLLDQACDQIIAKYN